MNENQFDILMEKLDMIHGQLQEINNKTPLWSWSGSETVEYTGQAMSVALCTCHLKGQGMCTVEVVCPTHG